MPSRNIIRTDAPESYYHIYARGISKQQIFLEEADFVYFEKLFARYLSAKPVESKTGLTYPHYGNQIELLAFCLMSNHIHMLIYQAEAGFISKFMQSLMISYNRYFNLKYKRTGPLFESRYKASRIDYQNYLEHISRYIHLNPRYWKTYKYSSLPYYMNGVYPEWLKTNKITALFSDMDAYFSFLIDYEEQKEMLAVIKRQLAI